MFRAVITRFRCRKRVRGRVRVIVNYIRVSFRVWGRVGVGLVT